eukprot:g15939.t1
MHFAQTTVCLVKIFQAAVSDASGKGLLSTLTSRLSELLRGRQSRLLPSQTIVVSTYALAKSGYKGLVEKAVWIALAQHARRKLFDVSLSEERKSERSSKTTEQAILGVVCAGCQFSLSFRRSVERHSTGDSLLY